MMPYHLFGDKSKHGRMVSIIRVRFNNGSYNERRIE